MTVSALTALVSVATLVTLLAPFILLILWFRDWLKGQLW